MRGVRGTLVVVAAAGVLISLRFGLALTVGLSPSLVY